MLIKDPPKPPLYYFYKACEEIEARLASLCSCWLDSVKKKEEWVKKPTVDCSTLSLHLAL